MKQWPVGKKGIYMGVILRRNGKYVNCKVHILMARTFLGPRPAGLQVCHNDGNGHHNRITNLRYDTQSNNELDKVLHGTHPEASRTHCARGHEFTPENTWLRVTKKGGPNRKCKKCHNINIAAYRARKKAGLVKPRKKASVPAIASGCTAVGSPSGSG